MDKKYMKMHANTIGDMFFKRKQTNAHLFRASKSIIETSRLRWWYTTTLNLLGWFGYLDPDTNSK